MSAYIYRENREREIARGLFIGRSLIFLRVKINDAGVLFCAVRPRVMYGLSSLAGGSSYVLAEK